MLFLRRVVFNGILFEYFIFSSNENVDPTLMQVESFNFEFILSKILWQYANPIPISLLDWMISLLLLISQFSLFASEKISKRFILFFLSIPQPESETEKERVHWLKLVKSNFFSF